MCFKCDQALFSNMISLITGSYCSMILGVLQISSTTRNLVPRFKRGVRGGRFGNEYSGSSHPGLLFWKRLALYIDVFISLLRSS